MKTKLLAKNQTGKAIAKKVPPASNIPVKKASKKAYESPFAISKRLDPAGNHFIVYPTERGYCFAAFWRDNKTDNFQQVASSHKPLKVKEDCIKNLKKFFDGFGNWLHAEYTLAFDHVGKRINLKRQTEVIREKL